jgi:hypothetical protein
MATTFWNSALVVAFFATLPAAAVAQSTVQSGGTINSYSGPLGVGITSDGTQPVQGTGSSWFRDRATGDSASFAPSVEYEGYPWPAFNNAGTGFVPLVGGPGTPGWTRPVWTGSGGIDFWTLEGNTQQPAPSDVNTLVFRPNDSSNVVLGSLFKIATLEFTNGTWFGSTPPIDPGNGPLYEPSVFGVSLSALPNPQIGTPTFPLSGIHQWNGALTLTSTFGPNTPDYVSLSSLFGGSPAGYFAVNEGATGSIEIWGKLGSLLVLEYRNPVNGSIVSEIPTSPVPEPSVYLQLLLGIGVLVAGRKVLVKSLCLDATEAACRSSPCWRQNH